MVPVICPRIASVATDLLHINTEQALVQRDAVLQSRSLAQKSIPDGPDSLEKTNQILEEYDLQELIVS